MVETFWKMERGQAEMAERDWNETNVDFNFFFQSHFHILNKIE